MTIKVTETPQTPLKVMAPEELAEGRKCVVVWLEEPITLQVENAIVTYPAGHNEAPCPVANALVEAGAEIVGLQAPAERPAPIPGMRVPTRGSMPTPTRGPSDHVRFAV